jgi:hypothetical protein
VAQNEEFEGDKSMVRMLVSGPALALQRELDIAWGSKGKGARYFRMEASN